jgi:hypothetical protein
MTVAAKLIGANQNFQIACGIKWNQVESKSDPYSVLPAIWPAPACFCIGSLWSEIGKDSTTDVTLSTVFRCKQYYCEILLKILINSLVISRFHVDNRFAFLPSSSYSNPK